MKKNQNRTAVVLAFQNKHHLEYWFRRLYSYFVKNDTYLCSKRDEMIMVQTTGNAFTFIFCINSYRDLAGYHNVPIFYNIEYQFENDMVGTLNDIFGGENNGIN